MNNEHKELDKAIQCFGSQVALAGALGIVPMAITHWKKRGRVPPEWCLKLETLTEGKVSVHRLRPDIFGPKPSKRA